MNTQNHGILCDNVHYWHDTQGQLKISLEDTKQLLSFNNVNDGINYLYLNGFESSARDLNKIIN